MGPQFNPCGRVDERRCGQRAETASMGPQFNPCGRLAPYESLEMTVTLQWGRSLIPAEGHSNPSFASLQCTASMGPQFNPCGRVDERRRNQRAETASMGPQFNPCGRQAQRSQGVAKLAGFNGAAV